MSELEQIEQSHTYSNGGPVNSRFEQDLLQSVFGGVGQCMTVCNATLGLMLAIREVIGEAPPTHRRYALMPSFTFAATGQAALWCGLTPLLCDIDPETWLPDPRREEELLQAYGEQVAVVVPYATFGNNLDLEHYERLSRDYRVPIVVDAAASLGSLNSSGRAFGTGFSWPVVFSMHATKAFSVGEGGIVYCGDQARLQRLRAMGSYGFGSERSAESLGLNVKMSEVTALTAQLQLNKFPQEVAVRTVLGEQYLQALRPAFQTQRLCGLQQVQSFYSVLLPRELTPMRTRALTLLRSKGIGAGNYFSPHLAEQPLFARAAKAGDLAVTNDVAARIVSLPLFAAMTPEQVMRVVVAWQEVVSQLGEESNSLEVKMQPGRQVTEVHQVDLPAGSRSFAPELMSRCHTEAARHRPTAAVHWGK